MSLTTGAVIHHRYRVLRRLGTGGLGSTYEVWDANRGLPVALKVLDRWGGERHLRREFALLRGVVHPHLLRVRDLGVLSPADPRPFYTSDRIDGRSLDAWAKTQPFPRVLGALADAVSGLVYLHLLGVRHGDFKPSNVLMSSAGGAVLIDLSAASALARLDVRGASDVSGTPGFMAPEVATGDIDRRSDLFSVGVTLTRLAEGRDDVSDEALALGRRLSSPDKTARLVDGEAVLDALDALGASAHALTDRRRTRPFTSPVFLGRESAFTRFDAFLERLLSGHAGTRVFRIEGPSGSGRSQLLTELKWRAQPQLITIEGQPRNPRPVAELLSRLDGTDEESGGALDRIAKSLAHAGEGEPRILVLDDADRMPVTARERWAQLLRGLPADGPLGVLTVSEDPLAEDEDIYRLEPLGEADLRRWCAQVGAPEIAPRRMRRAVGNQIVLVEPLLRHLVAGGRPEDFVAAAPSIAERPFREVEVLATVALSLQGIEEATMGALGLDADAVAGLRRDGLLRSTDGVLRLQAEAYRQAVLEQLSDDVRTRAEAELRASLPMHGDPAHAATIQRLLLRGQRDDAEAMVLELEVAGPRAYRDVARQLGAESRRREVRRWSGEILVAAGDPQAALEVVEELLSDGKDFSALHLAGEAYLKLSRPDDAVRWERAAASVADTPTRRASLADLQARIAIAQGNPDAALRAARAALELTPPARLCDRLTESVGLASAYLGDSETADTALAEALQGHAARHDLAGRFRTHSYRAIAGQLAGAFDRAAEDYRAAIALAEQGEFDDQLAAAWLNLATVEQERGAYAAALDGYERALRFSILLGRTGTEGTVRFNLANLALEIGLLERADGELARAAALAKDLGLTQLEVPLRRLRGELALRRGEHPSARKAFLESRRLAESRGLLRDEAEASLFLAELAHREVDPRQTGRELARAEALIERADRPRDLMQRLRLLRAAAAGERGDLETARSHVEAVRSEAASGSFFEADAFTALADIYDRQGMVAEASKLRSAAQTTWDRVAGFLPEEYRQAYRDHPRRRPVYRASPPLPERSPVAVEKARLGRFFAVNRKLNSTLRLDRVLEYAVDAAIELTAAERGFVLLEGAGEGGELTVASARNLDRERLPRSHLKFSRSIAERVVASGEPVSTVNARDDARFRDERSVHAMRLQSVASVPIRGREGIIGALYLDNRFEQGRFEPEDIELLQAFADQVAMAIDNAELHAELRRRSAALEAAQEELRALVAGQAQQIENLTAEVEARQSVLEYRYDYSHIIGRSAPMRRVLEVLDRVIASDLTVLVQGETGTGKELIARAIHYNSKRREGPMVSLNCAALPENLIEAELFGHEKGAFTGADVARRGLLVAAEGGTVFLDELGEMPLNVQAKLLRALQEREVWPLGASRPLPVDLRLVAATHRRLRESVAEGTFREDLFYRVSVVGIDLPPLRERREDIPELIAFFLEQAEPPKNLSVAARRALIAHPWPGNVRELENVLRRAAVLATGSTIDVADLDLGAAPSSVPRHRGEFREKEADRILQALDACGWNVSQVSRDLGIPRQTLYRKLRRYRIERPDG